LLTSGPVIGIELPAAAGIPQRPDNWRQAYPRSAWISVAGHGLDGPAGVVTERQSICACPETVLRHGPALAVRPACRATLP